MEKNEERREMYVVRISWDVERCWSSVRLVLVAVFGPLYSLLVREFFLVWGPGTYLLRSTIFIFISIPFCYFPKQRQRISQDFREILD